MIPIKCYFRGRIFSFNSLFGILLSKKSDKEGTNYIKVVCKNDKKIKDSLDYVMHPYKVTPNSLQICDKPSPFLIKLYARLLIWMHRHFYLGLALLSHLRLNYYDSASDAIDVFCKIHPENQKILCLPRSIFAATTSKKFKRTGAMFIGVFLPSRHMHAWIIEDGSNAYRHDHIWINFTPVSMMI